MMQYIVPESDAGQRLDVFVQTQIGTISRAYVQKLCDMAKITVQGKPGKPGQKLRTDEKITVDYDLAELARIPDIELPVLYEDDDCIVMNKRADVLTHSKGAFNPEATVATFLRARFAQTQKEHWDDGTDTAPPNRAGIVHRLDRATSGVIIGAKHPDALRWLQKQFSQRRVKKTYNAIVQGSPNPPEAIIDMPIERNPQAPATFRVGPNGKPAVTWYKILKTTEHYSLLELKPETGRTHQLRVHLKQRGHPILGDQLYGGAPAERLFLHALSLEITLPNRDRKVFTAPLPPEFNRKMSES